MPDDAARVRRRGLPLARRTVLDLARNIAQDLALALVLALAFALVLARPACAGAAGQRDWKTLLTTHAIVFHETPEELARLEQALTLDPALLKTLEPATAQTGPGAALARKLDFIVERVQTVLDMRRAMPRVQLRVYDGLLEMAVICPRCRAAHLSNPRSWYVFEQKSIYISLVDVRTGILVHEVAHHVIDHYFQVRPDAASAEILAVFAEKNFAR